jgi:nitrate/TMAO reductase-like tetraheme cytochrome c subunit
MMRYFIIPVVVLIGIVSTGLSQATSYRETFEKEFMNAPWQIAKGEISACIQCHTSDDMGPEMHEITRQWKESFHAKHNISCHDCHGGAPEDASVAMMHQRGFKGSPKDRDIPEFCGTCHIAFLNNYLKSGHGKTFLETGEGPNCVTCHGSHNIQLASMDIINEQLCSQCHTYERAQEMKQALFLVESKLSEVEETLGHLKLLGINIDNQEKVFYRNHAGFRALSHSIDVAAVRTKSGDYIKKLEMIESEINESFEQLKFRKNFFAYLLLIFIGLSIVTFLLSKSYEQK